MSFAENLKQLRKERQLSQEDLAEILDVSRQSVSKWEMAAGYPEVEKLMLISEKMNISLDSLMGDNTRPKEDFCDHKTDRTITITSPNENVIVTCYKVQSTGKMHDGKYSPHYALFGVSGNPVSSFWGEPTTLLGWYADEERIKKEISEIHNAIICGNKNYTLKYSVKTKRNFLSIKIADK